MGLRGRICTFCTDTRLGDTDIEMQTQRQTSISTIILKIPISLFFQSDFMIFWCWDGGKPNIYLKLIIAKSLDYILLLPDIASSSLKANQLNDLWVHFSSNSTNPQPLGSLAKRRPQPPPHNPYPATPAWFWKPFSSVILCPGNSCLFSLPLASLSTCRLAGGESVLSTSARGNLRICTNCTIVCRRPTIHVWNLNWRFLHVATADPQISPSPLSCLNTRGFPPERRHRTGQAMWIPSFFCLIFLFCTFVFSWFLILYFGKE